MRGRGQTDGVATGPPSEGAVWPTAPHDDIAKLFALERERLLDLLARLQAPDWEHSSPCPAWTIRGLACHLLGEDLGLLARQRDDYHGTKAPTTVGPDFIAWLDNLQDEWVTATRRLSPHLVTDLLAWSGPQIVSMFAAQDLSSVSASVFWAGPQPVPVWLEQLRDLSEFWIHRQQILQALGRPSDLRGDLVGPVLDGLRWAYPHDLRGAAVDDGDTVVITVTGPVARTWYLVFDRKDWRYATDPGERVAATLDVTTEQFWRLITNNLPAQEQADLATSGDKTVVQALLRTRAIIGEPR